MTTRLTAPLLLSLGLFTAFFALAHSPGEVLRELREKEPYLQLADRQAPGFALEDPDGRKVALADLRGKVVVLNFIYSRCTDVCPLHSELIARIQEQVNATRMRDQVQFITIATDTEDAAATTQLMRAHGEAHGLDPRNWIFLYGGTAELQEGIRLTKAYGLEFTPAAQGVQMHGVVTHVIDQEGILRARFHGLKVQPLSVTAFINTLLYPDHHGPAAASAAAPPAAGSPSERKPSWPGGVFFQAMLGASFAALGIGVFLLHRRRWQRRQLAQRGQKPE
jgi:protein SCO1/2